MAGRGSPLALVFITRGLEREPVALLFVGVTGIAQPFG